MKKLQLEKSVSHKTQSRKIQSDSYHQPPSWAQSDSLSAISIAQQKKATDFLLKVVHDNSSRVMRFPSDSTVNSAKTTIMNKLLIPDLKSEQCTLYLTLTGIFLLQGDRTLGSYYLSKTDTITLKKYEPPKRTVVVTLVDVEEEISIWKETTVMGLIQLLEKKDLKFVTECCLSIDGKTPLPMNDQVPCKVSNFIYSRYPALKYEVQLERSDTEFDKSEETSREQRPTESIPQLPRLHIPAAPRSHSIPSTSLRSPILTNQTNIPSTEKRWWTFGLQECCGLVPLNYPNPRIFMPPLESYANANVSSHILKMGNFPKSIMLPVEEENGARTARGRLNGVVGEGGERKT